MSSKIEVQLGPVQETLLIPLYGRAVQTRKGNGLIQDHKAVEIVEALDYDFSKWEKLPSMLATGIRTRIYDQQVQEFLQENPKGSVIEIGAGLNTRYERLDNGKAQWLEIDLPDTMALRRKFFQDTPRRRMLVASVLDPHWLKEVQELPAPYLFVSEAVIIYLEDSDATRAIQSIASAFPGAKLFFDTTSQAMVEGQDKHDVMRLMPKNAWFRWGCDDPKSLERLGMKLQKSLTMLDMQQEVINSLPWNFRWALKLFPGRLKKKVSGYHMNLFQVHVA